jgi:hypothetical protein
LAWDFFSPGRALIALGSEIGRSEIEQGADHGAGELCRNRKNL